MMATVQQGTLAMSAQQRVLAHVCRSIAGVRTCATAAAGITAVGTATGMSRPIDGTCRIDAGLSGAECWRWSLRHRSVPSSSGHAAMGAYGACRILAFSPRRPPVMIYCICHRE